MMIDDAPRQPGAHKPAHRAARRALEVRTLKSAGAAWRGGGGVRGRGGRCEAQV